MYGIDPQICPKCTIANQVPQRPRRGEREIIAVILRDDVIVKILEHMGLPSVLPVFKPARGPPIQPEEKLAAPLRTRCRTLINRGPLRSAENRGQESVSSAYR